MKTQGIYVLRNTISGRVYVGSSQHIEGRWATHRSVLADGKHHARMLQRSWTKHGPDAFVFEVLEVVENAADLLSREQHWIDALNAYDWSRGLNGRQNASSPRGHKMGPEARANMSAAQKGKRFTPEHAAKLAPARNEGRKRWLAKIRSDPEAARAHSEKLSKAFTRTKKTLTPEHIAKIVMAHRGMIVSRETRAKQSEAQKKRYARDVANGVHRFGRSPHTGIS